MKKVFSLILAVIMVFVLATPVVTATNNSPFTSSAVTVMSLIPQDPPQRPTAASISAVSITLNEIPGAQYGINTIASVPDEWQDSVIFDGLEPNTPYFFYARMKATDTHMESPPSLSSIISTDMAALSGTVTIDGITKFGQQLTANIANLTTDPPNADKGTLIYRWWRGEIRIGTDSPNYTLVQADLGHTITVIVTATSCTGEVTSDNVGPIEKADGPGAPEVDGSYTGDGTVFTYTVDYISGAEYRMDNGDWQDSNVFTGIVPSVPAPSHTFHARIKETLTHNAGDVGSTVPVNFVRLPSNRTSPPLNHSVTGDFPTKTVTIITVPGAEYSFNGINFDQTNTRTSSQAEELTLYIRWAETLTHLASYPPNRLTINTAYQEQDPPPDFNLTYRAENETSYIVSIPIRAGAEYRFDGLNWSDINEMPGLLPGQTITGFMRMAARPGYNPSPSVSASVTLPLFQVRAPTFTPSSGTRFDTELSVTINSATVGATIHYTLDGTPPTTDSPVYGTITLTETTTVRAIAVKEGMADSAVVSATFTKGSGGPIGGFGGGGGGPVDSTPDPDPSDPTDTAIDPTEPPLAGIGRYDDVTAADWFYEAVEYVSEMGLMTGTGERIFSPHATMTRAMLVTVLYRLEGEPMDDPESEPADELADEPEDESADELADELADDPESEPADDSEGEPGDDSELEPADEPEGEPADDPESEPSDDPEGEPADDPESEIQRPLFSDIVEGAWYYNAVVWAAENNIVEGYDNGLFGVNDPVTREQTVAILYRYANWKELDVSATADLSGFADVGAISAWALDAMRWAVADGIVQGRTPTSIAPQGTSTRAEVATIFARYIENFLLIGTSNY